MKKQLDDLNKEKFNLRFQASNGQLSNTGRVREVRRGIAKIKTLLTKLMKRNKCLEEFFREVVSDKSDKTVVVKSKELINILFIRNTLKDKKYSAHDESNKFKIGDFVQIRECSPKSKTKL